MSQRTASRTSSVLTASPSGTVESHRPSTDGRHAVVDAFTLAALGIVVMGAALRLYAIVAFTWDQDELYTRVEARDLFHTTLRPGIDARPLYYLLQHPLLSVLPHTAPMLRLLPLIFGVVGLWVTWLAGRRTVGRVGGLVAVFLAATSTWHIEASAQARYYSLVYLFAALVLLWLPTACDSDRKSAYFAAFAALALGTLTHPSFVFPIAGLVLAVLLVGRDGSIRWQWPTRAAWIALWGPLIAFAAVFFAALSFTHRQGAIRNFSGRGLAATLRLVPAMVEWITPAVLGAAIVGAVCLLLSRRPGERRLGSICLIAVAITFGGLFAASFWTDIYATYATALLPMVFVAAGVIAQRAVDSESVALQPHRGLIVAATALSLLGFAVAPAVLSYLSDGSRFDYRPAYRQIEREDASRPVITWPGAFAQEYAPELTSLPLLPRAPYLDSLLARNQDVWLIASIKRSGIALDDAGEVDRWIAAHCRRHGVFERPRFDYRIYRVELHRCRAADPRGMPGASP